MSSTILNDENFIGINPSEIITYLRHNMWQEYKPNLPPDKPTGVTFIKELNGNEHDVFVPFNNSYGDYIRRIQDILRELEEVESRNFEKIFYDIKHSSNDILRIRVIHPLSHSGELPLIGNSQLIDGAKELMATAVHYQHQKKTYYPKRTLEASNYLKKVTVAQSEVGSYILKLTIPIPPSTSMPLFPNQNVDQVSDPFERDVTKSLMISLSNCLKASEEAVLFGGISPFMGKQNQGINANLLGAISKIGEIYDSNDVEVSITWSVNRPTPSEVPSSTFISRDWINYIKEAARYLKETAPIDSFELIGFVTKLESEGGITTSGFVTISGVIEGSIRNVKIELSPNDHALALDAYRDKTKIKCCGELKRELKTYILQNPRNFETVEPE